MPGRSGGGSLFRLPYLSFGRRCPRCATVLEPDYVRPPWLGALLVRISGGSRAWRWCRNCQWRGLAPRGTPRRHRRAEG